VDEHLPETLRAVEHELTALLRRGRALSWKIVREVHPNLDARVRETCPSKADASASDPS
jgi:hypothetical protein